MVDEPLGTPARRRRGAAAKDGPDINPIYADLTDDHEDDNGFMAGFLAYGFYKESKREWVTQFWKRHGRKPNDSELKEYMLTWTPSRLDGLRSEATQALAEYAAYVVSDARESIRQEAVEGAINSALGEIRASTKLTRGKILESLILSMMGAALYTVLLIVIAVGLRFAGIDILGIQEKVSEELPKAVAASQAAKRALTAQ